MKRNCNKKILWLKYKTFILKNYKKKYNYN